MPTVYYLQANTSERVGLKKEKINSEQCVKCIKATVRSNRTKRMFGKYVLIITKYNNNNLRKFCRRLFLPSSSNTIYIVITPNRRNSMAHSYVFFSLLFSGI